MQGKHTLCTDVGYSTIIMISNAKNVFDYKCALYWKQAQDIHIGLEYVIRDNRQIIVVGDANE